MSGNKANQSKKVGDELFVVEQSNASFENNNTNYIFHMDSQIPDVLRKKFGAFWVKPQVGRQKMISGRGPVKSVRLINTETSPQNDIISQRMEITFQDKYRARANYEELEEFFNNGQEYYDHATVINIYEDGNNQAEQAAGVLNLYAEIKSDYNFLEKRYEEFVNSYEGNIRELDLPNFYNFLIRADDIGERLDTSSILSMAGRIRLGDTTSLIREKVKPVSDYFTKWAENFADYKKDTQFIKNYKMRTVTFSKKETDKLEELYKYKEMFPMFNTVEFNVENDALFGTTLEETKFSSQLRSALNANNAINMQTAEVRVNQSERIVSDDGEERFEEGTITSTSEKTTRTSWDVEEVMNMYEPQNVEELVLNEDILPGSNYRAFYNLMSIIMKGRVEKIKKQVFRDYKEVIEGKTAYNEPVFYTIRKYDEENNLLQTFNFTNTDKLEVIKFVDTQVKYNKRYNYKISSYNLVVGTKYKFENPQVFRRNDEITRMRFKVISEPSVRIIEVPVFEKSVLIYDNPPIAPEIEPIFFRGVNDKVKFFFNSAIGRNKKIPIVFGPEETRLIEKYKIAQDIPVGESEIEFETDDSVNKFTLYKMNTAPKSYQDFLEKGENIEILTDRASSASYLDDIAPNRKYYYCLRARDYHNNPSYPSVVYEIEVVDDAGSIYPVSRVYEFEKPETKQPKRGVKRFIHIKPSFRNLLSNEREMGIEETDGPEIGQRVVLGEGRDTTWGKRFKLRLTSKSTGKKIDFNFTFNTEQDREVSE